MLRSEATSHPETAHVWPAGPSRVWPGGRRFSPLHPLGPAEASHSGQPWPSPTSVVCPGWVGGALMLPRQTLHPQLSPGTPWPEESSSGQDRVHFQDLWSQVASFYSQGIPVCLGEERGQGERRKAASGVASAFTAVAHHPWERVSKYSEHRPKFREPLARRWRSWTQFSGRLEV